MPRPNTQQKEWRIGTPSVYGNEIIRLFSNDATAYFQFNDMSRVLSAEQGLMLALLADAAHPMTRKQAQRDIIWVSNNDAVISFADCCDALNIDSGYWRPRFCKLLEEKLIAMPPDKPKNYYYTRFAKSADGAERGGNDNEHD